jgi:uncharacterized protein YjeT (DUF2065 family)
LPPVLPEWGVGQDLLSALALLLVIEGILPFARPAALRRVLVQMSELNDRSLRISGLVSMILGAALLYLARH